jgi:hypothetical protein
MTTPAARRPAAGSGAVQSDRVRPDGARRGASAGATRTGMTPDDPVQEDTARLAAELAAERNITLQLQRAILPLHEGPFDLPGLRAVVRYLPASRDSRVGGDWYITAEMPGGHVLLAIGDVGGHGLAAAAGMARLRDRRSPARAGERISANPGQPSDSAATARRSEDPRPKRASRAVSASGSTGLTGRAPSTSGTGASAATRTTAGATAR